MIFTLNLGSMNLLGVDIGGNNTIQFNIKIIFFKIGSFRYLFSFTIPKRKAQWIFLMNNAEIIRQSGSKAKKEKKRKTFNRSSCEYIFIFLDNNVTRVNLYKKICLLLLLFFLCIMDGFIDFPLINALLWDHIYT